MVAADAAADQLWSHQQRANAAVGGVVEPANSATGDYAALAAVVAVAALPRRLHEHTDVPEDHLLTAAAHMLLPHLVLVWTEHSAVPSDACGDDDACFLFPLPVPQLLLVVICYQLLFLV